MEKLRRFVSFGLLLIVFLTGICGAEDLPLENQCQPLIEKAINDLKNENFEISYLENNSDMNSVPNLSSELLAENQISEETINSKENNYESDENTTDQENKSSDKSTNDDDDEEDEEGNVNEDSIPETSNENNTDFNRKEKQAEESNENSNDADENENSDTENVSEAVSSENNQDILNADNTDETESAETESEKQLGEDAEKLSNEAVNLLSKEESTEEFSENVDSKNASEEILEANEIDRETNEEVSQENTSLEDEQAENYTETNEDKEESHQKDGKSEEVDSSVEASGINKIEDENDKSDENIEEEPGELSNTGSEEREAETNDSEAEIANDDHPEEDLLLEFNVPTNLRDRSHISEILHLEKHSSDIEEAVDKAADIVLHDLKRIYDNAIKPLETVYKYRDLSNRHFGDAEIFSKPLVLLMGPWSGGKSTILNYLTGNEYTEHSIRSGAEPSPAYFNILMYGDETEELDGTQLAADWTFSGLQKFGQGMLDRLHGIKLRNELLKKINIVEIPGLLEVRKQVSRLFPFNDACQWFIDRADMIFLVYDPSKLDVGPETEAILDQLKGREYQTRILLNKADTVKPEELLRVQSALIWNISPLMSSAHPPMLYTVSLWSHPYRDGSPVRLLQAQERALLKDLQGAVEKRIENKIASARRFAVRIRNHAKMIDCYLTTYYNHKTLFGNKKQISDHIIENPSHYHIYEGLSTLTNISRYDLPNEDAYRDFFKLNPLYSFKRLAETCTYFRGCPINQLDIAISYQLPELAGKYKKILEQELAKITN